MKRKLEEYDIVIFRGPYKIENLKALIIEKNLLEIHMRFIMSVNK